MRPSIASRAGVLSCLRTKPVALCSPRDFVCHRCRIAAGILHGIFHALAKLADASSYEKLPFYVHLIGFTLIFLVLTKIRIWFDLAEADVVVSDQLAVRKSLFKSIRQFRAQRFRLLARMWRSRWLRCSCWPSESASGT